MTSLGRSSSIIRIPIKHIKCHRVRHAAVCIISLASQIRLEFSAQVRSDGANGRRDGFAGRAVGLWRRKCGKIRVRGVFVGLGVNNGHRGDGDRSFVVDVVVRWWFVLGFRCNSPRSLTAGTADVGLRRRLVGHCVCSTRTRWRWQVARRDGDWPTHTHGPILPRLRLSIPATRPNSTRPPPTARQQTLQYPPTRPILHYTEFPQESPKPSIFLQYLPGRILNLHARLHAYAFAVRQLRF